MEGCPYLLFSTKHSCASSPIPYPVLHPSILCAVQQPSSTFIFNKNCLNIAWKCGVSEHLLWKSRKAKWGRQSRTLSYDRLSSSVEFLIIAPWNILRSLTLKLLLLPLLLHLIRVVSEPAKRGCQERKNIMVLLWTKLLFPSNDNFLVVFIIVCLVLFAL